MWYDFVDYEHMSTADTQNLSDEEISNRLLAEQEAADDARDEI